MLLFEYINLQKEREKICGIFGLLSSFSPMAGHSWREGIRELKDYQHSCLSLAGQHRALGYSVEDLWYISFNDQIWQTFVWNLLWAENCWCLEGSQQMSDQRVPGVYTSMKAGAALVFFLCFTRLWPSEGHFPGKSRRCGLMKIRPLGDGVDYSFFLYHYKIHPYLASAVIFHCRQTWCCERKSEIICSILFHLGPYPSPESFFVSPAYGRMSTVLRMFKVLGKFSFSLWTLFQRKLRWGMLMLGRRTRKNTDLGLTRSPRREVTISHITLAQNNCYIFIIVDKRKGSKFILCK